ncbi:OLC1v1030110C1 [Oldenlandia corymbosa var. corymbosa]|uniref:OLC1v1030110C1 n=1 Tax=Oldenlandia corymbosa var. corymbosa TaxID=529605 RepID=A0AAV1CG39_OLDCO|nr:OLC1v1030110C1 [Oldenlandia corymbosa var. corymbosa]
MELAPEVEDALKDKKDINPILAKYADRLSGGTTTDVRLWFMTRKHFRDADLSVHDFFKEMEKVLPNIFSPVDLLNTSVGPSFIYNMPANVGSPAEIPPSPDDVAVERGRRDSLDGHPPSMDANGMTTSGTNTTESSPGGFEDFEGYPTPEVDVGVSTGSTPTDVLSTSGKVLVDPSFQKKREQLSTLEADLCNTIHAIHETELEAAKKIIFDLGTEVANLRQLRTVM